MTKQDIIDQIIELTQHNIPYYAYGDNEAACVMSNLLDQIQQLAVCLSDENVQ